MEHELKALLSLQDEDGFFPTYRSKKGQTIVENRETKVKNMGIHTFVLEKLVQLFPESADARKAFEKGLKFLFDQAIEFDCGYLWRWLKEPTREDYLYPADYDDTLRARAVIEIALKNKLDVLCRLRDFDYSRVLSGGLTSNGVFTFIGNKPGNVVCPVVNANILHAYGLSLKRKGIIPINDLIFTQIRDYLNRVVESEEFQLQNFSRLSKFYLSYALLTYLLTQQSEYFDKKTLDTAKRRIETMGGTYSGALESAWATSTLIILDGNERLIVSGIDQIQASRRKNGLWNAEPFYQHQRLGNVFGSSAGTSVFCLEALSLANYSR